MFAVVTVIFVSICYISSRRCESFKRTLYIKQQGAIASNVIQLYSSAADDTTSTKPKRKKKTISAEDRANALLATQAGAVIAMETTNLVPEISKDGAKKVGRKATKSKKIEVLSPRQLSGLNFTGIDKDSGDRFEYDVPFLDVPKW